MSSLSLQAAAASSSLPSLSPSLSRSSRSLSSGTLSGLSHFSHCQPVWSAVLRNVMRNDTLLEPDLWRFCPTWNCDRFDCSARPGPEAQVTSKLKNLWLWLKTNYVHQGEQLSIQWAKQSGLLPEGRASQDGAGLLICETFSAQKCEKFSDFKNLWNFLVLKIRERNETQQRKPWHHIIGNPLGSNSLFAFLNEEMHISCSVEKLYFINVLWWGQNLMSLQSMSPPGITVSVKLSRFNFLISKICETLSMSPQGITLWLIMILILYQGSHYGPQLRAVSARIHKETLTLENHTKICHFNNTAKRLNWQKLLTQGF